MTSPEVTEFVDEVRVATQQETAVLPEPQEEEEEEQPEQILCELCTHVPFKTRAGLAGHMRTHPQDVEVIDTATLGLTTIPANRPTQVWYFRPPVVQPDGTASTGLPEDCFYTGDGWAASQVDQQTRKTSVMSDGSTQTVRLVNPIDRHEMMVRGVPVIGMHKPDHTPQTAQNWGEIIDILGSVQEEEIDIERELVEAAKDELTSGGVVSAQRTSLRNRIRRFEQRIAMLEAGVNEDGLYKFFVMEAERSQLTLRSPETRMTDLIDERVSLAIG